MPAGPESSIDFAQAAGFYGFAAVAVLASLAAVTLRNIFHAVLLLIVSFVAVAGLYLTLNAAFLAMVQVIIYAGAIAVLMLFALFLTRNAMSRGNPPGRLQVLAGITALLTLALFLFTFANTHWAAGPAAPPVISPDALADALFTTYLLPFELASVVLLVAMIGAIVLVKEE